MNLFRPGENHAHVRTLAEREEPTMHEMTAPAMTVTEVVLPGKVEPAGLRLVQRALPPPAAGQALVRVESTAVSFAERRCAGAATTASPRSRSCPATIWSASSRPSAPAWTARWPAGGWPR